MFDLSGKLALVTGASGGIGAAIAKELHKCGASIAISGTRTDSLEKLATELGERVHVFPGNLLDAGSVESLMTSVENVFGTVDILVNNAGITRDNLLMRMSDEEWSDVLTVNLEAPFRLMRRTVRDMIRKGWGRIINISSVVGFTGNPGQVNYCATKAGIVGMTKSIASEVAKRGVTVNCVAPGFIDTPMTAKLNEERKRIIKSMIPAGSMGTPEDVASAVLFLASEGASYITGHTIHVNGGMYMG